jgi:hypothetical protein
MTTTKNRIAVVKGTFLRPGVSKNRRLYTKAQIAEAVAEMQHAIDSGEFTMLTHHGARDALTGDVTRTAGRITKVGLAPDGSGTFEADIADTAAGRDIAALTTASSPYLKGVSMAGNWKGKVRQVRAPDGGIAETGDGLSVRGIDFTHNPGVNGAQIHSAVLAESNRTGLIFESLEDQVIMEQTDTQTLTRSDVRKVRMAAAVTEGANRAEADLSKASLQDLEALAFMKYA